MMFLVFLLMVILLYCLVKPATTCRREEIKKCSNCAHPLKEEYNYCPSCKEKLKKQCEECGKMIDLNWRKCPYCD